MYRSLANMKKNRKLKRELSNNENVFSLLFAGYAAPLAHSLTLSQCVDFFVVVVLPCINAWRDSDLERDCVINSSIRSEWPERIYIYICASIRNDDE